MKRLIMINGTMGAGKTATSFELLKLLPGAFLDGDWCWYMSPFVVTDETKAMVLDNIAHLLRAFLSCSAYENVIFCWVMQHQETIDELVRRLVGLEFSLHKYTLMLTEDALRRRVRLDVERDARSPTSLERSLDRLPQYAAQDTRKIDVSHISAAEAAQRICMEVAGKTCDDNAADL